MVASTSQCDKQSFGQCGLVLQVLPIRKHSESQSMQELQCQTQFCRSKHVNNGRRDLAATKRKCLVCNRAWCIIKVMSGSNITPRQLDKCRAYSARLLQHWHVWSPTSGSRQANPVSRRSVVQVAKRRSFPTKAASMQLLGDLLKHMKILPHIIRDSEQSVYEHKVADV